MLFKGLRSGFRKYVCGVFGLLVLRNGQNAIKQVDGKRRQGFFFSLSTFSAKSF
jgi:hypothetical protein